MLDLLVDPRLVDLTGFTKLNKISLQACVSCSCRSFGQPDFLPTFIGSWWTNSAPSSRALELIFDPRLGQSAISDRELSVSRQEYLQAVQAYANVVESCVSESGRYPLSAEGRSMSFAGIELCAYLLSTEDACCPMVEVVAYDIPPDKKTGPTVCDEIRTMFPQAEKRSRLKVSRGECRCATTALRRKRRVFTRFDGLPRRKRPWSGQSVSVEASAPR